LNLQDLFPLTLTLSPKGEEKEDDLLPLGRGRKDEGLQLPITSS